MPSSESFANTYLGLQSGNKVLTIYNNTASGTIYIETIAFTCTTGSASDWGIASGTVPFQMGQSQLMTHYSIFFQPHTATTYNCDFVLTMLDGYVLDVPLTGTGLTSTATSTLNKMSMSFPNQTIGTASATQSVTITNNGTSALTLNSISIAPPDFTTNAITFPVSISANSSFTVNVSYTPAYARSETGTVNFVYEQVPGNGVSLTGNGVAATALDISTNPTLAQATQGYAYQANLATSGGTGPYTWALATGSSLPPGLTISSAGVISGTVSSSASTTTPYTFTVQVTDSSSGKTASSLMNIAVWLYLGDGNGESCNDISWNDPVLGTPMVALTDLGTGEFEGQYEGGLYPNGSNTRPSSQNSYGVTQADSIQPLDASGNPSPTGKYVLMAVGESTAQNEFDRFLPMGNGDPAKNPNLVLVNGAQGGATPNTLTSTTSTYWVTVLENYLPQNGVTANQVVAIWMEDTDGIASGTFPSDITDLQSEYETMMQTMLTLFPNLKLVYFSSRVYGGYSNGTATPDNPEPYAYEVGYAVKWAIGDQINGKSNLCDGNGCSPRVAPWMSWGTYYWSNGMPGRQDGLEWDCEDFSADGTHPSSTYGQLKVATALLQFLKTDDTSTPWYLAPDLTLAATAGNNQTGGVGTTLPTALTVTAENLNSGVPQSGVSVTFSDNGAHGIFGTPSGVTGSNGQLSTTYTLPSTAQTVNISATATGYATANFTETATANTLAATAGNNQTGAAGTTLPVALQVTATSNGSVASGVTVNFTDGSAGGSFNPASGVTGSNGTISTIYTLPSTAKTVNITASATGYTSAAFTETATAPVQTLTATSGNNQTCPAGGGLLPLPLVVTATTNGNNSSGVTVSFTDNGGGSFGTPTGVTGSNGQVQTTYTCSSTATTITITASATGYTSATFTETGSSSQVLSVAGGNNQTGVVGTKLAKSLEVKATVNGVATAGVPVTFSDGGAQGTFGNPSGVTGSSGTIFTTYTLPSTPQTVTITATSTGYTSAIFTETATASTEVLTATAGNNQTGPGGVQYPVALQITATNGGTDESGVTVTFTDNGAGGTFGTPSGVTGSNGTVSTTYTPKTVTQTTTITITASATGYTSATFSETATAAVQTLTATSGNNQSGPTGTALPLPLVVTATSNGNDASGVTVSFIDNGAGGSFNPASGVSGSNGQVSTTYTCGSTAATVTITASATGYTSASFTETCTAAVKTLAVSSGNNQSGQTGTALPVALAVLATSNGTPVAGVTVTFNDNGAGGLFNPTSAVTNSSGIATTVYTLGKVGTITVTASATGYTSANFTETSTGALILSASGGNNQSGTVGTTLPVPLSVTATNNGVVASGVAVTFTDNGAGGTFGTPSGSTNSSGVFSSTYTLPSTAMTVTITASATGYTSATFTETAITGSTVTSLAVVAGGNQKGTVGTILPKQIQVKARNASGQGVSGASITFSDGGAGGSFNPATAITGSTGVASTSYTLPTKPKTITVTASDGSVTGKTIEQSLAGTPDILSVVSGNNQTGVEKKALPRALVVSVTDQYSNGLGGIAVTFNDNGAGGTFSNSGSVITSSNGQASITYTCGSKAETVTISATTSTLGPANFTETVKQ